jgi:hypothetical protein
LDWLARSNAARADAFRGLVSVAAHLMLSLTQGEPNGYRQIKVQISQGGPQIISRRKRQL